MSKTLTTDDWRRAHEQGVRDLTEAHIKDGKTPREAESIAKKLQEPITREARARHEGAK